MKKILQWKKAYTDKDGYTHIPIKVKGKKKFKCDECGKKVREVFTINPMELLQKRELCRACYCDTPESLDNLIRNCFTTEDDFLDNLGEPYELDEGRVDFGDLIKDFEKETGKSIFKNNKEVESLEMVVIVHTCEICGKSWNLKIDSEFAKIPYESSWSCECGEYFKTKWDGKELKYL